MKEQLTVATISFDEWLRGRRSALDQAAASGYPGDHVDDVALIRAAREIGHRFVVETPSIQQGDAAVTVKLEDAARPPRGVPAASDRGWVEDDVKLRVRVTVAVDGQADLLALKAHGITLRPGQPPMRIGDGCVWTHFPHPATRSQVELWVHDVNTAARLVTHQVNLLWNAGTVGQVLDGWRARRERQRKVQQKLDRAQAMLGHLGYPVERDT